MVGVRIVEDIGDSKARWRVVQVRMSIWGGIKVEHVEEVSTFRVREGLRHISCPSF